MPLCIGTTILGAPCHNMVMEEGSACHVHRCDIDNIQAFAAKTLAASANFPARTESLHCNTDDNIAWGLNFVNDRLGVKITQIPDFLPRPVPKRRARSPARRERSPSPARLRSSSPSNEQPRGPVVRTVLRVSGPAIFVIGHLSVPTNFQPESKSWRLPPFYDGAYFFQNNAVNRATFWEFARVLKKMAEQQSDRRCITTMAISRANIIQIAARQLAARDDFPAKTEEGGGAEWMIRAGGPCIHMFAKAIPGRERIELTGSATKVVSNFARVKQAVLDIDFRDEKYDFPEEPSGKNSLLLEDNGRNRATLRIMAEVINETAARFFPWEIRDSAPPVELKGIANCPQMPAEFEAACVGMRPIPLSERPQKANGVWTFGSNGVGLNEKEALVAHLRGSALPWAGNIGFVFGMEFFINRFEGYNAKKRRDAVNDLFPQYRKLRQPGRVLAVYCGWAGHARVVIYPGTGTTWYVIDPWKRRAAVEDEFGFQLLKDSAKKYRENVVFHERPIEQGSEGTCGFLAFARAIQIARDGWPTGADSEFDECILIFVYRLISHFSTTRDRGILSKFADRLAW